ncbi:MAG: hypothetical protein AAGJ40_09395 [Planctomycetota bacterium]
MLGFIDDGQTITRFIAAKPRMHHAVRLTFRPVPTNDHNAESAKAIRCLERGDKEGFDKEVFDIIGNRLISWEFIEASGKPVPRVPGPTPEVIAKTVRPLQNRIVDIVYAQNDGGDEDPFDTEAESTSAKSKSEANLGNSKGD